MIEEGQNTIDFGMKTINVEKALKIVEEDNAKRGIGRRKRNNINKARIEVEVNDINDTNGNNNVGKKKTKNGVVGIAKEVQSVEDFEDKNEAEIESKKIESNKNEVKPKQKVEVHDDAYYEELFNSVEF